jgi:hypothetical protein
VESQQQQTLLAAGGHAFRPIEFANSADSPGDVSISGARVCNELNDANALAASETYIKNYRTGNVVVRLPDVAPGTECRRARDDGVQLRHERAVRRTSI